MDVAVKVSTRKLCVPSSNQLKFKTHPDKVHILNLKGQSNEIFDPQFFLSFEPAWATD